MEGVEVLAAVLCSACTLMLLGVSTWSVSTHADVVLWLCVVSRRRCFHPEDKKEGPVNIRGVIENDHRVVLSYVPPVISRWSVRNAQNYHRGVVFCGGFVVSYVGVSSCVIYGSSMQL